MVICRKFSLIINSLPTKHSLLKILSISKIEGKDYRSFTRSVNIEVENWEQHPKIPIFLTQMSPKEISQLHNNIMTVMGNKN